MTRNLLTPMRLNRDDWVGRRSSDGVVVPPDGGYLVQEDWLGRLEIWLAWTNYPAPYWNEWSMIRQRADNDYVEPGSLTLWWYGEWI